MNSYRHNFFDARLIVMFAISTLFVVVTLLSSCGLAPENKRIMNYSFSYDMTEDGQNSVILNYKLQADGAILIAPTPEELSSGRHFPGSSTFGPMQKATSLYVKWQDPISGKLYEDTATLTKSLPDDMTGTTIRFMIKENVLFVYLESSTRRPQNVKAVGPKISQYYITQQIYPIN